MSKDTSAESGNPSANPTRSSSEDTAAKEPESFFLATYKTKEEAEKGFKEKDSTIGKLAQEKDVLSKKLEVVEQHFQALSDQIKTSQDLSRAEKKSALADLEQQWDSWRDGVREDAGKSVDILKNVVPTWIQQATEEVQTQSDKKISDLEKRIVALQEQMIKQWPSYNENRSAIEKLKGYGLSLDKAMQIVTELVPKHQDREAPPGAVSGGALHRESPLALTPGYMDALEKIVGKLTPEEMKQVTREK